MAIACWEFILITVSSSDDSDKISRSASFENNHERLHALSHKTEQFVILVSSDEALNVGI